MARYIDADLLMPNAEHKGRYDVVSAYDIANTPAADVRENVHGEWLDKIADIPNKCSICGCYWDNDYLYGQEIWYRGYLPNFCPNCGADMIRIKTEE